MEQLIGYKIAQQRKGRQKQRFQAGIALVMFGIMVFASLVGGSSASACTIPLLAVYGLFALISGIQLYFASPRGTPSPQIIADETGWLFGDNWRDVAGPQEYLLAQERIRQRRNVRAYFYMHVAIFLIVYGVILKPDFTLLNFEGSPLLLIVFGFFWFAILVSHAIEAFPTRQQLANRERDFGQAILDEMQHSTPDKAKRNEKTKNDVQYRMSAGGELIEMLTDTDEADDQSAPFSQR